MSGKKPSKREIELVTAIRDRADDLRKASNYAEFYLARARFVAAMADLNDWAMASVSRGES